jgi:hypothetical protein
MRPDLRRTAERLGLDRRTIRWFEAHGHLQRLALTEREIRARLYRAHLAHLRLDGAGDPIAPGSTTSKAIRGREGTTMEKATTRIRWLLLLVVCATALVPTAVAPGLPEQRSAPPNEDRPTPKPIPEQPMPEEPLPVGGAPQAALFSPA